MCRGRNCYDFSVITIPPTHKVCFGFDAVDCTDGQRNNIIQSFTLFPREPSSLFHYYFRFAVDRVESERTADVKLIESKLDRMDSRRCEELKLLEGRRDRVEGVVP